MNNNCNQLVKITVTCVYMMYIFEMFKLTNGPKGKRDALTI